MSVYAHRTGLPSDLARQVAAAVPGGSLLVERIALAESDAPIADSIGTVGTVSRDLSLKMAQALDANRH